MFSSIFSIIQIILLLIYVVFFFIKPKKLVNLIIVILVIIQLSYTIFVFKMYDYSFEINKYRGRCSSVISCDCPDDSEMCDCIICKDPNATSENEDECDKVHIQCRNNQRNEDN